MEEKNSPQTNRWRSSEEATRNGRDLAKIGRRFGEVREWSCIFQFSRRQGNSKSVQGASR